MADPHAILAAKALLERRACSHDRSQWIRWGWGTCVECLADALAAPSQETETRPAGSAMFPGVVAGSWLERALIDNAADLAALPEWLRRDLAAPAPSAAPDTGPSDTEIAAFKTCGECVMYRADGKCQIDVDRGAANPAPPTYPACLGGFTPRASPGAGGADAKETKP
jgi:hypothetical protein